mmetsp:Transcript_28963/g.84128  ORF Transcript_28963/g.84128 Transcript_28963/m.84128 type:complete len:232 (+) Transcript_28963:367-1062(+)
MPVVKFIIRKQEQFFGNLPHASHCSAASIAVCRLRAFDQYTKALTPLCYRLGNASARRARSIVAIKFHTGDGAPRGKKNTALKVIGRQSIGCVAVIVERRTRPKGNARNCHDLNHRPLTHRRFSYFGDDHPMPALINYRLKTLPLGIKTRAEAARGRFVILIRRPSADPSVYSHRFAHYRRNFLDFIVAIVLFTKVIELNINTLTRFHEGFTGLLEDFDNIRRSSSQRIFD